MTIQHAAVTDPNIHEPKGASTALVDTVYVADGLGSGVWTLLPTPSNMVAEEVLRAANNSAVTPVALDTPIKLTYGAAQFGPSDPVQLDALGNITLNEAGLYQFRHETQFGRSGGAGSSILNTRLTANGVQVGRTYTAKSDSANLIIPAAYTFLVQTTTPGVVFAFESYRDSAGINDGGFYPGAVSLGGWQSSPSLQIVISRWRNPS